MAAIHFAALLIVTSVMAKEQERAAHSEAAATAAAPPPVENTYPPRHAAPNTTSSTAQEIAEPVGHPGNGESGKKSTSVRPQIASRACKDSARRRTCGRHTRSLILRGSGSIRERSE
jgi:hypothetical protein